MTADTRGVSFHCAALNPQPRQNRKLIYQHQESSVETQTHHRGGLIQDSQAGTGTQTPGILYL